MVKKTTPPQRRGIRVKPGTTSNRPKKNSQAKPGLATAPRQSMAGSGPAIAWKKLLRDPCNADLTSPCYSGSGSGLFLRQSQQLTFTAYPTAADLVLEFSPGNFTTDQCIRYAYSTTTGGSLGTAASLPVVGLIGNGSVAVESRCIAACIRLQYQGTEMNRKGLVGCVLTPSADLLASETVAGTAYSWMTTMPNVYRIGDAHEFLWAPGENDQSYTPTSSADPSLNYNEVSGNTLRIALSGIDPGSVVLQLVSVWEWIPALESSLSPWASQAARNPASSIPFQTVMHSLGDLQKFVVSRVLGSSTLISSAATLALKTAGLVGL